MGIAMMELDDAQDAAVAMCCDTAMRLVSITGEAGTGKTTIIKRVCDELTQKGVSFALCAPTGKAARRIKDATGYDAQTIHKLLGFNKPEIDTETGEPVSVSRPSYTRSCPLPYRIVICDEYAMVSTGLHRDLVDALGTGLLRLFGDVRQLPPIENGGLVDPTSPFENCLKKPNTITLNRVYRQEHGNGILEAARQINRGHYFTKSEECELIISDVMVKRLYDMVREAPDQWGSLRQQIISPARKSDVGTIKLNAALQQIINPQMTDALTLPRHKWNEKQRVVVALGDKVVCESNVYDMRDYQDRYSEWESDIIPNPNSYIPCPLTKQMLNGEVGKIVAIGIDGTIEIDFGDRVVEIPSSVQDYWPMKRQFVLIDHRKNIDLAYALTTHKCQGSEYDVVAYIMARAAFYNLSRQNFYTALTRAKQKAIILTDQHALGISIRNVKARSQMTRQANAN
jgi:exodeoxyribonuclease V alpha subunit